MNTSISVKNKRSRFSLCVHKMRSLPAVSPLLNSSSGTQWHLGERVSARRGPGCGRLPDTATAGSQGAPLPDHKPRVGGRARQRIYTYCVLPQGRAETQRSLRTWQCSQLLPAYTLHLLSHASCFRAPSIMVLAVACSTGAGIQTGSMHKQACTTSPSGNPHAGTLVPYLPSAERDTSGRVWLPSWFLTCLRRAGNNRYGPRGGALSM